MIDIASHDVSREKYVHIWPWSIITIQTFTITNRRPLCQKHLYVFSFFAHEVDLFLEN